MCLIGKVWIKLGPQWGKKALIRALLTGASWQNFEKGNQSKKAWTVFKKSSKTHEDLSELEKIYQGFIILMQISRPLTTLEWWIWLSGQVPQISGESCKKLDSTSGMTFSQLVDVAFKVFNREQQQKKEDAKQSAIYLALASWKASNLKTGKSPWGKEQHAYCKEEEHWKMGCPLRQKNNKRWEPLTW